MKQCRRCRIEGLVQGVFFRASTCDYARRLGLSGWAHNLADGSVEVLACGDSSALDKLSAWLWHGPVQAKVSAVHCHEEAWRLLDDFAVRR